MEKGKNKSRLSIWWQAVRAFSFTASIMPVTVGAAVVYAEGLPAIWWLFPFIALSSVLLHAATNLVNDYFDFKKGLDREDTKGGSRALPLGLLTPEEVIKGAYVLFLAAALFGVVIIWVRGWPILLLGLIGLVGGYFYSGGPMGYKYVALGDLCVFVLMGPLMVVGSHFALSGTWSLTAFYFSLPIGCLVASILCANNYRDRRDDGITGSKTMANLLPPKLARLEYYGLVLGAYLLVGLFYILGFGKVFSLTVYLTLPIALNNIMVLVRDPSGQSENVSTLDVNSAQLHLAFSLLLVISLVAGA